MIRGILCRGDVLTWSHRRLTPGDRESPHLRRARPPTLGFVGADAPTPPPVERSMRAERTPLPGSGVWGRAPQIRRAGEWEAQSPPRCRCEPAIGNSGVADRAGPVAEEIGGRLADARHFRALRAGPESELPVAETIVLAYSGGLDTSVATKWLQEERGYDVVCLTVDLGRLPDVDAARARGLAAGSEGGRTGRRARRLPALLRLPRAGRQRRLRRRLPARDRARTAVDREAAGRQGTRGGSSRGGARLHRQGQRPGAPRRGHPDAGAGADDRRHRARERDDARRRAWPMRRSTASPSPTTVASPYSTDENLWGRSVECGVLEDPWAAPPEDVYEWTRPLEATPDKPSSRRDLVRPRRPRRPRWRRTAADRARRAAVDAGRRTRAGAHRHGREPPRRHQVARDLRGAGRCRAAGGGTGRWRR